ncbi:MAG TPA: hypothetical protein VH723_07885, partial [Candidatus Limnocylindrales bacterium]
MSARPATRALGAAVATILVLALALPASARGPVTLSDPQVTPRTGTTATTFTLAVTYRHAGGRAPEGVAVVVGRRPYRLARVSGDDWRAGVVFRLRTKLPAGKHQVRFVAIDAHGEAAYARGGWVTVEAASVPREKPKPDKVSPPRGSDGNGAQPKPTPKATSAAPPERPADGRPGGSHDGSAASDDAARPDDEAASPKEDADDQSGWTAWTGTLPPGGPAAERPRDPLGGPPDPPTLGAPENREPNQLASLPGSWSDLASYVETLGIDRGGSPLFQLIPVVVWSAGGVAMAMAFGLFGKRRRDGEPTAPDEVLEANAARGVEDAATAALVPEAPVAWPPADPEASLPRWRRPSLLEARKTDPIRSGRALPRLSFTEGAAVPPMAGYERRYIRYMVVQLLDTPDEFRGTGIGTLAQGDEVQLIDRSGTYWLVLCPDGREGWI